MSERARRAAKANDLKEDIVIGVVDTSAPPSLFLEGVRLAIEELNQEGGVLGRKISPIFYDDERSPRKGLQISEKLAENPDVVGVVGHCGSNVAIPASITYEENGILFISPGATDPAMTRYGGVLTFRNIPSDKEIGREIAEFAHHKKFEKMLILYDRESSGKRLAEIFEFNANRLGIRISAKKSYFSWQKDYFRLLISDIIKEYEFDAVFLGGVLPSAATIVKLMRTMGVTVPILGGDFLDSPELSSLAGRAAEGTIVSTVFDPGAFRNRTQNFVKAFKSKFGVTPDTWAAQGYDAIQVLAVAMENSDSSVPIAISTALRSLDKWNGVTGSYSFAHSGDIIGKTIFFKEFRNGNFEFLDHKPSHDRGHFDLVESITLRLPVEGVIPTIDPGQTQDVTSIEVTEQLFLGLTDFDPRTYEAVPELAESWTVSEDGKTYRFNMRKDVFWTNGDPVTADDVVWAIRRNILPETKSPYAHVMYVLQNAQAINTGEIRDPSSVGAHTVNDFTVEFWLEHPAAYFPALVGLWVFRPLPEMTIREYQDQWTDPQHIQTNGSYSLAAWDRGSLMVLRKNPTYYDAEKVSISEVRYYVIQESSVGLAMYENNELDIMGGSYLRLPLSRIQDIKADPLLNKDYSSEPLFCNYAYGFNTKRPPVDNPLVRKAISAAINRDLLITMVTKGGGESATTFTRPPVFGSVDPKEGIGTDFDPAQAKKWLAQAGYPDGDGFPEITLVYNISETHEKIARAVRTFLRHYLNITIILQPKRWSDYVDALEADASQKPHLFRFGWCGDYPDANNWLSELFHPFQSSNYIGWENAEFAELMDNARENSDPKQRKALYKRAEQILTEEEAVVLPIYFETSHCLVKPRVKGWYNMAIGGQHIRNWHLKEDMN